MIAELLVSCAISLADPAIMQAIVYQESGGHPWVINDNTTKRSSKFSSKEEAVAEAQRLIAAGHSVDMGLAQINSANLSWLGLSVEQVFDPCTNLQAGARVLRDGLERHGSIIPALSHYNTGKPDSPRGLRYAAAVLQRLGSGGVPLRGVPLKAVAVEPPPAFTPRGLGGTVGVFSPRWQ